MHYTVVHVRESSAHISGILYVYDQDVSAEVLENRTAACCANRMLTENHEKFVRPPPKTFKVGLIV